MTETGLCLGFMLTLMAGAFMLPLSSRALSAIAPVLIYRVIAIVNKGPGALENVRLLGRPF